MPGLNKALATVVAAALATLGTTLLPTPAHAAGSSISGVAFNDSNRNGRYDAGETSRSGFVVYVYDDTTSAFVASTTTDSAGNYAFAGLTDGAYRVQIAATTWSSLRHDWVPTTTGGSLSPTVHVALSGAATVNWGIRQIERSTTVGSPITSFAGTQGLRVESYDDVLSAQQIYDALLAGPLVGAEASSVTVRFDICSSGTTTYGARWVNSQWTNYSSVSCIAYDQWLNNGDTTLFHEYGHSWSMYYADMVQQDSTLSGYLQARGLAGDSRVDSSYMWDRHELIAEDYRQLFGTANAQQAPQMNTDIPPAAQVPGLKDYLQNAFRTAPASSGGGSTTTTATPLSISSLSVSPQPVSKSGTVSFAISASAAVTVQILNAKGSPVRTLLSSAAQPAGSVSATWDRKDAVGSRVKSGTYTASVTATDGSGATQSAQLAFSVQ